MARLPGLFIEACSISPHEYSGSDVGIRLSIPTANRTTHLYTTQNGSDSQRFQTCSPGGTILGSRWGLIFLSFVFILLAKLTFWLSLASVSNVHHGKFTRFLWNNVLFALTARVLINVRYLLLGGLGSVGKSTGVALADLIDYVFFRARPSFDKSSKTDSPFPPGFREDDKRWYEGVNGRPEDHAPFPRGWFTAYDSSGRPFYHGSGEKSTWTRPPRPAGSPPLPDD